MQNTFLFTLAEKKWKFFFPPVNYCALIRISLEDFAQSIQNIYFTFRQLQNNSYHIDSCTIFEHINSFFFLSSGIQVYVLVSPTRATTASLSLSSFPLCWTSKFDFNFIMEAQIETPPILRCLTSTNCVHFYVSLFFCPITFFFHLILLLFFWFIFCKNCARCGH